MRPFSSLIIILFLTTIGRAQTRNYTIDSPIESVLKHIRELERQPTSRNRDTTVALLLDSCARFWIIRGRPTEALESLRRYEAISTQYEWLYGEALLLYRKGQYESMLGNTTKAKAYFLEAIPRLKQVGRVHVLLLAYVQMGLSEITRDLTDTTGIRLVIGYLQEGLAISAKTPGRISYSALSFRLGHAYMRIYEYKTALQYINESWQESLRNGYTDMPFANCLHFAVCYTHLNDETHRKAMWDKCLALAPTLNVQESYAFYWYSADMNRHRKQYAQMAANAQQLVHYAHLLQSPTKRLQAHRILFDAYKQLNQPALALAELETVKQLEDSTLQQRSNVKLAELQLKFDVKQKQAEVSRLTIDNQRIQTRLLVGGMLMLLLLMGLIVYNNRQLRQKNRAISEAHLQGQTLERQRVAADLHDNLGTTLAALQWSLDATDKSKLTAAERAVYATIREQVSQAYRDVRLLSHNLLPDELAKQGLAAALQKLVEKMNRNTPVNVQLTGADELPALDQQAEFELYSICLELLNNTIKHAQATEARIDLHLTAHTARPAEAGLLMTISDNGKGVSDQPTNGRGLQNVAARVASLSGTLVTDREPGGGVRNRVNVPVTLPVRASSQT
ncbi:MAG: hypothetical protein EOO39_05070 [Cytophagaceae bacterium]|nr:MAG: hypothetical protein EOO39_05070 [Cytophagaceae bacterium]